MNWILENQTPGEIGFFLLICYKLFCKIEVMVNVHIFSIFSCMDQKSEVICRTVVFTQEKSFQNRKSCHRRWFRMRYKNGGSPRVVDKTGKCYRSKKACPGFVSRQVCDVVISYSYRLLGRLHYDQSSVDTRSLNKDLCTIPVSPSYFGVSVS